MDECTNKAAWTVKYPSKDRLVKARKWRRCTAMACGNTILSGRLYLDVDPPMRQNGYFAMCLPCAEQKGLIERAASELNRGDA